MKLVTFRYDGNTRIGSIAGDEIIDLNYAYREMLERQGRLRAAQIAEAYVPAEMTGFIQGGAESGARAREAEQFARKNPVSLQGRTYIHRAADVRIEAPLPNPGKIICVGHNYREHILEMGRGIPDVPVVFAKYRNTIIANGDPIPKPILSDHLDYEGEMAFVIGKNGRHIAREDAMEHVAGYTVVNDVSVRDYQKMTMEWLKGKTFEGTLPMGPHLLTADELPDPHNLNIRLRVNGETRQQSNTSNLVFDVPFLVTFLSGIMTLEAGDIVLTGTPGGVGAAMQPPTFLRQGDVVEVEVEGLGTIRNSVQNEVVQAVRTINS